MHLITTEENCLKKKTTEGNYPIDKRNKNSQLRYLCYSKCKIQDDR